MKQNRGACFSVVLCLLLLPIATVNLTLVARSYLHPDKVATFLGYGPLIVETGSMWPEFKPDDLVLVKKAKASALKKNTVIAYYDAKGVVVTHRIVQVETDATGARQYITKGDANNVEDRDPVAAAKIVGVVVKVFPNGGKALRLIGQPIVTILVIAVPIGLYLGIGRLRKKLRKKRANAVAQPNEPDTAPPQE